MASTASMTEPRKPSFSSWATPLMVVPPGRAHGVLHGARDGFRWPCRARRHLRPSWRRAGRRWLAADRTARRRRPSASMYMSVKAGAQPATHHGDVHMRGVHALDEADRPEQLLEGFGLRRRSGCCTDSVTSTPLPTAIGVFGMVHWIWMSEESTDSPSSVANRSWYFLRFQPAAMETTNLARLQQVRRPMTGLTTAAIW